MDGIDREIIEALAEDGRVTATELAKRIQLGLSATSERLRQLRRSGVIAGFTVLIDPTQVGRPIEALVDVRLDHRRDTPSDRELNDLAAVTDAVHLTGRFDVQLRVAARDVAELNDLLETLKSDLGAEETNTRLILRNLDGFPRLPVLS